MSKKLPLEDMQSEISRRKFLKIMGLSAAGLIIPPRALLEHVGSFTSPQWMSQLLGRITKTGHVLHQAPKHSSDVIQEMQLDSVWQITGVKIDPEDGANPVWYELNGKGYAHTRHIQPVKRIRNKPVLSIPEDGCLGEVTMPFVDAYSKPDQRRPVVYRLYYDSTFWILNASIDHNMQVWYELLDDRTYRVFYVPADHLRLVPDSELGPLSPGVPPEDKKLVVDLSNQVMDAYERDQIVFTTKISSGIALLEGGFATPRGIYRIIRKRPCRHMSNPPNAYGSGFDLPGVPWVCYFTSDGVAFHGTYWHNDFGNPHSHGCINMTPETSKWVYRWTTPAVPPENYYHSGIDGTRVVIK